MYILIILIIGIFIGWNLPQPQWAKSLQRRLFAALRGFVAKKPQG